MNAQQSYGLSSKVRDMWERNQDLLRNAGSLAATTGMTSIFGFVFTIVAARMFSPDEVGWGNAAINAMQLFGTIGMFGLGTMLVGELPRRQGDKLDRGQGHVAPQLHPSAQHADRALVEDHRRAGQAGAGHEEQQFSQASADTGKTLGEVHPDDDREDEP